MPTGPTPSEIDALLRRALQRASVKDAVEEVAAATGRPRREIYQRALALADEGNDDGAAITIRRRRDPSASPRFALGLSAESRAAAFLIAKGFRIVARRFRSPVGEVDIVARRGKLLVFVEVKARSSLDAAAESLPPANSGASRPRPPPGSPRIRRTTRATSDSMPCWWRPPGCRATSPRRSKRNSVSAPPAATVAIPRKDRVKLNTETLGGRGFPVDNRRSPRSGQCAMALNVAVQMDPIERINIRGDSTFALLLEAQARGHRLSYYTPDRMAMLQGRGVRDRSAAAGARQTRRPLHAGRGQAHAAHRVRRVLMRQDPPFDLNYITTTHLLERIHPKTLVVNDPASVRNAPEKMFVTEFPDLMPPTLLTRDLAEIKAFRAEHGDIVMKPLYGHGGGAVFRLTRDDLNFGSLYDMFAATFREPWVIQKFLPEVRDGDKRIILVDGEFAGAVNRVPAAGRSALQHGARRLAQGNRAHAARARDLPHAWPAHCASVAFCSSAST